MEKITIEFNPNIERDLKSHTRCMKSKDMVLVLKEITKDIRTKLDEELDLEREYCNWKSNEAIVDKKCEAIERFYELFNETLEKYNIDIEKLS